jgi:hypothetical protein
MRHRTPEISSTTTRGSKSIVKPSRGINITKYKDLLRPLKHATKRLKGRSKSSKLGAIYEVIPMFKYLLNELKTRCN